MRRRLAVSDIHGCGQRFVSLLRLCNYDHTKDQLFILGDTIDRGGQVRETVDLVRKLEKLGAVVLCGNHEYLAASLIKGKPQKLKFWDYSDAEQYGIWWEQGGNATVQSYGGKVPDDVVEWMIHLPVYYEEDDCILVHAGLAPKKTLAEQSVQDMLWIRERFLQQYRGKLVIAGHTPTFLIHKKHEVYFGKDKILVDCGAVFGGQLAMLDIDSKEVWYT
jgi:serine/threonine protein phosphatase 1